MTELHHATGAAHRPAVDAARWPAVAHRPGPSRPRDALARSLVHRALDRLPLRVRYGAGPVRGATGPLLEIADPEAFVRRVRRDGLVGFGESYLAHEWDAVDLVGVLTVFAEHADRIVPRWAQRLRGAWAPRRPAGQHHTLEAAPKHVHHHYDLSNELFGLFLDPTLSYSAALFSRLPATWDDLAAAQARKIDRLLDLAGVGPGTRLLEIGTGWGALALRAALRGARVVAVTLSEEQRRLAARRALRDGLTDRITLLLRDYRELEGRYDAIISVEMIEAIGAAYWPRYFGTLQELLAPGGRIALQAITMPHDRMLATRHTYTWMQKYIFPGGFLPSVTALEQCAARHTRLRVARRDTYGDHYAQTLRLWRERFTARDAEVAALGFDTTFRRMWTFYLAYSEAGFRARYLDVQQILLQEADR
ncbi:class I SAM-dependent methyltransferase [Streptomyces sp. NPDC007983]|uniref:class I SAM-dependent methyltransferase n=1 Tax=Streptomyces sp. NPDC007983 TaxID=3364800 RepID=UPI0036E4F675